MIIKKMFFCYIFFTSFLIFSMTTKSSGFNVFGVNQTQFEKSLFTEIEKCKNSGERPYWQYIFLLNTEAGQFFQKYLREAFFKDKAIDSIIFNNRVSFKIESSQKEFFVKVIDHEREDLNEKLYFLEPKYSEKYNFSYNKFDLLNLFYTSRVVL